MILLDLKLPDDSKVIRHFVAPVNVFYGYFLKGNY